MRGPGAFPQCATGTAATREVRPAEESGAGARRCPPPDRRSLSAADGRIWVTAVAGTGRWDEGGLPVPRLADRTAASLTAKPGKTRLSDGWAARVIVARHVGPRCVIPGLRGCLLCSVAVAAGVLAGVAADAPPDDVLAQALEANRQLARLVEELRAENARLREEAAQRDAELEQVKAALGVLQRMVFGRSSERSRPEAAGRDGD